MAKNKEVEEVKEVVRKDYYCSSCAFETKNFASDSRGDDWPCPVCHSPTIHVGTMPEKLRKWKESQKG